MQISKRFTLKLVFILLIGVVNAQQKVADYTDSDGNLVNGYIDERDYNPAQTANINYYANGFESGHYWDLKGEKHVGLLKFHSKKIWFKSIGKDSQEEKLKPDEVKGLVIATDSFFVAKEVVLNRGVTTTRTNEFVKYYKSFGEYTFAVYYRFTNQEIIANYLIKRENDWYSAPSVKVRFNEFVRQYFSSLDYYAEEIASETISDNQMPALIDMLEHQYAAKYNKPFYFDKYWNRITDKNKATYSLKVVYNKDTTWTLNYYNRDNTLFRKSTVTKFSPIEKVGKTNLYYPNGSIRKTITYEKNIPKETIIYFNNGVIQYSFDENKVYSIVNDEKGNSLLDTDGNGQFTFYDSLDERGITRTFTKFKLTNSYFEENGSKIFQLTDNDFNMKLEKLIKIVNDELESIKPLQTVNENAEGTYYLLFQIGDKKGHPLKYRRLNSVHDELDIIIDNMLYKSCNENAEFRLKLGKLKINGKKSKYEVMVPLRFRINRFYRAPNNYLWNNFWIHQQQMNMFNQNNLNHINPPSFPSNF